MDKLNKNTQNHLLINNIIDVFSNIDLKISKLQEYSENDFKTFSRVMKQSHEKAKQISNYADEIIELSSIKTSKKIIETLNNEYLHLADNCNSFQSNLKNQKEILSDFLDKIRHLSLPVKNLKQNFFTLKYILANLKLETFHIKNETNYVKNINEIEQNIQKNTSFVKEIELNFSSLQILLEDQVSIKATGILQNFDGISNSFDRLKNAANLLNTEYHESEKNYPKIKEKIEEASVSINKIVIKLQYQDIIRQKMEHMQTIYKKIIDYFDDISKKIDNKNDEVLQYYSKIEYIASLQVAQLIQTNKEYEQAVESISEQLLQITLTVNNISYYFKIFTNELPKQEEIFLQWTRKYLSQIKVEEEKIQENKSSFTDNITNLKSYISNFKLLFIKIENISQTTITHINNLNIQEYTNLSKTINFKKLIEVSNNIEKIIFSIHENFNNINPEIWNLSNANYDNLNLNKEAIENIELKIGEIKSNEDILGDILKKSINLAKTISSDVISSIQKVSYYDFFEKSIEEIIEKLNFLNEKLKYKKRDLSKEEIDNLVQFENIYTVKTEKEIHDLIINNGKLEATENLENLENDEDSEVEFF